MFIIVRAQSEAGTTRAAAHIVKVGQEGFPTATVQHVVLLKALRKNLFFFCCEPMCLGSGPSLETIAKVFQFDIFCCENVEPLPSMG